MKILLVNTNRCRQPAMVMPFGACLVAQAAEAAGHDVRMVDLMFERRPEAAIAGALGAFSPDVVGLSVRNLDTNDISNPLLLSDQVASAVRTIRSCSKAPVVLGGPAVSLMPEQLLRHSGADMAARGDGEAVFTDLLGAIGRGGDPSEIEGVLVRDDGRVRGGDRPRRCGMIHSTVRDFGRWIDAKRYLRHMASVPVQSKRGCPFSCIYCTYAIAEGSEYRLLPADQVADEVLALADQGLGDVEFVDNVFNAPYEHAMAICKSLAGRRRQGLRIQSLEINPRFFDRPLLTAMRMAGFVAFGITAESAADEVLASLEKGFTAEDLRRAAADVAAQPLPCLWIFLVGGPGETSETLARTLEFCRREIRPTDTAFFNVGIRIYPGTRLEQIARQQGLLSISPDEMLRPVFYVSPQTPLPWLREQLSNAASRQFNIVISDALPLPLLQKLMRLGHLLGMRPPLWRHTGKLRRVLSVLRMDRWEAGLR